jgi:hypothetical protein
MLWEPFATHSWRLAEAGGSVWAQAIDDYCPFQIACGLPNQHLNSFGQVSVLGRSTAYVIEALVCVERSGSKGNMCVVPGQCLT